MELINCYNGYEKLYKDENSNNERLEVWFNFMEKHESVRRLCINDYKEQGYNWRDIAYERVFNYDKEFVERMTVTSKILEEVITSMKEKLNSFFKLEREDTAIIIYHGLGNGAGWVTTFNGRPAIYLGIEKIVELGWDKKQKLKDLVAHEYGHLVHMQIRKEPLAPYSDFKRKTVFKMYTEGVATYCECIFNGREISSPQWYSNAQSNIKALKSEFIKRLNEKSKDCEDFFGDWNPVLGISEAGYFLGLKVINFLATKMPILDIMRLEYSYIEHVFIDYLNSDTYNDN